MSAGSPLWQGALLISAILFLAWETWRGWRAGVIRSGVSLAAIVLSALIGFGAAKLAAMPFGGFDQFAGAVAGLLVGGGLAICVFLGVWIAGALLFKRTEHQSSGMVRMLWGSGGAVLGFLVGLVIVWSSISVIRAVGALAQARVEKPGVDLQGKPAEPPKVASGLVTLKESLELGPTGKIVQAVDPFSPDFYELIVQVGKLSGDQDTMMRFLQYPGIQELTQHPRIVALTNDPAVVRAAEKREILTLMSNKALLAAMEDKEFVEEIKKIDLRAALKFALETPGASPSPSPIEKKPPAHKKEKAPAR